MVTSQKRWCYESPWGNGKSNHPGLLGNIMNLPTIYISSIVKEPHNITGLELMSFICASVIIHDITKVMGQ
jgi:hypothetical protein